MKQFVTRLRPVVFNYYCADKLTEWTRSIVHRIIRMMCKGWTFTNVDFELYRPQYTTLKFKAPYNVRVELQDLRFFNGQIILPNGTLVPVVTFIFQPTVKLDQMDHDKTNNVN